MDFATVCAMLGKTKRQVLRLMDNPQFPTPTGNDDLGSITWDGNAISAFGALLLGAEVNGWILTHAGLRRLGDACRDCAGAKLRGHGRSARPIGVRIDFCAMCQK